MMTINFCRNLYTNNTFMLWLIVILTYLYLNNNIPKKYILSYILLVTLVVINKQVKIENFDNNKVKRINYNNLTKKQLYKIIHGNKPCIFTHFLNKKELKKVTMKNFCNTLSNIKVKVRYNNYGDINGSDNRKFYKIKLKDYYKKLIKNKFKDKRNPDYVGNNKIKLEHLERCGITKNRSLFKKLPNAKMWIGPADSKTPLHKDQPSNLALQLYGKKEWIVFPKKDIKYLCYKEKNKELEWSGYDIYNKKSCETAEKAKRYNIILNAGEMLYLPKQWSHHVRNITDSIMVNFWYNNKLKI